MFTGKARYRLDEDDEVSCADDCSICTLAVCPCDEDQDPPSYEDEEDES